MEKHMHDHAEMLKTVRHELPKDEMLCDLADLFKLFGDTTRMRILFSLFESEMCVCAIAELLGMTQSAPVKGSKAEQFNCLPQGGQNNLLFPCR